MHKLQYAGAWVLRRSTLQISCWSPPPRFGPNPKVNAVFYEKRWPIQVRIQHKHAAWKLIWRPLRYCCIAFPFTANLICGQAAPLLSVRVVGWVAPERRKGGRLCDAVRGTENREGGAALTVSLYRSTLAPLELRGGLGVFERTGEENGLPWRLTLICHSSSIRASLQTRLYRHWSGSQPRPTR